MRLVGGRAAKRAAWRGGDRCGPGDRQRCATIVPLGVSRRSGSELGVSREAEGLETGVDLGCEPEVGQGSEQSSDREATAGMILTYAARGARSLDGSMASGWKPTEGSGPAPMTSLPVPPRARRQSMRRQAPIRLGRASRAGDARSAGRRGRCSDAALASPGALRRGGSEKELGAGSSRRGRTAAPRTRHDRQPLSEQQRQLAEQYVPLARSMARRLDPYWPMEKDELYSTAMLALVEAAQSFDPTRKVSFATFARHRIRGALRDFQRLVGSAETGEIRNASPMVSPLGRDLEQYGQVLGIRPADPVGLEIESRDAVEGWLRRLPRAHAAACRMIYLEGKSQTEAAAAVGCSPSYLSRLHSESITWLIRESTVAQATPTATGEVS